MTNDDKITLLLQKLEILSKKQQDFAQEINDLQSEILLLKVQSLSIQANEYRQAQFSTSPAEYLRR